MDNKPTLYLAGDSTVQSYAPAKEPQAGWGQMLWTFFKEKDRCRSYVRPDAPGSHCVTYEMPSFSIENHAFAARSSRSFIEQGRLEEIMKVARPGDFLALQFAHNDAYKEREERYVPVEKFGEWLKKYKDACDERGMTCIFVTPVTMRVFDGDRCRIAFSEYRDEMLKSADILGVPCVDLSLKSTELITKIGFTKARDVYLWLYPGEYPESDFKDGATDNAHFQRYGASLMASLVAEGLKEIKGFDELSPLKAAIADDLTVPGFNRTYPEGFKWQEDEDMLANAGREIVKRE